jgi:LAO/AO transport system kinase
VLLLPGGGDDLQGIKKGVIELADLIAINKADAGNEKRAERTASDYRAALHLLTPRHADWTPPVVAISGLGNVGLDKLWSLIEQHQALMMSNGRRDQRRAEQALAWMDDLMADQLMQSLLARPGAVAERERLRGDVLAGRLSPSRAVDLLIEHAGFGGGA